MKRKIIWWSAIVLWCGFIFFQSNQPGEISQTESNFVVTAINEVLVLIFGKDQLGVSSFIVRKSAHFLEYFILGMLLYKGFTNRGNFKRTFCMALSAGVLYAITDEIHQYFIPGREMKLMDVMIDSAGVFCGVSLLCTLKHRENIRS